MTPTFILNVPCSQEGAADSGLAIAEYAVPEVEITMVRHTRYTHPAIHVPRREHTVIKGYNNIDGHYTLSSISLMTGDMLKMNLILK